MVTALLLLSRAIDPEDKYVPYTFIFRDIGTLLPGGRGAAIQEAAGLTLR